MKAFTFWILFAVLIWFGNAEKIDENSKATQKGKDKQLGLFRIRVEKENTTRKFLPEDTELINSESSDQNEPSTKNSTPKNRQKRYNHKLPWRKDEFTYSILKYTRDLPARVQERVLGKAFQIWHNAAPQLRFTFKRNDPKADLKISFVKGAHGDAQAFDGTGPLIAHVYSPEDGRIHFDDDEWFTDKSKYGTNLLSAAVHEVGHALGMGHAKKKTSVMYKIYRKYKGKNIGLDSDDIEGIKALYRIHPMDRGSPNCKDKDRRTCVQYKQEGYCTPDYKDVMKEYCQFTCDLCDS